MLEGNEMNDVEQPITDWQSRPGPRGGIEFWRAGPDGTTLSVWQPHGQDSYWRMYWGISPVVRNHNDLGIFESPIEAICVLESLAAEGMKTVLLD
ncbi:hypothetical protein ACVIJW_005413 [Bradyrhizobium barranii subsp. barranii]